MGLAVAAWLMRLGFLVPPSVVDLVVNAAGFRFVLTIPTAGIVANLLAGVLHGHDKKMMMLGQEVRTLRVTSWQTGTRPDPMSVDEVLWIRSGVPTTIRTAVEQAPTQRRSNTLHSTHCLVLVGCAITMPLVALRGLGCLAPVASGTAIQRKTSVSS